MTGYIRLYRGWRDCDVFADDVFSERDAWVWLIEKAVWKPCVRRNAKGQRVELQRGQFHTSLRNLESIWGWGKNKVARFLERLVDHEMIGTVAGQSGCTITILNYEKYQDARDGHSDSSGTVAGQSRDTQEEGKEGKEEPNGSLSPAPTREKFPKPEWADQQVWTDFLANRKRKRLSNTPTAHKAFLDDVARHADDDWPPGRLLEAATAKGWGAIYPSIKETDNGHQPRRRMDGKPDLRGPRPDPALAMLHASARAEEAERPGSDWEDRRGAWTSLPALGTG